MRRQKKKKENVGSTTYKGDGTRRNDVRGDRVPTQGARVPSPRATKHAGHHVTSEIETAQCQQFPDPLRLRFMSNGSTKDSSWRPPYVLLKTSMVRIRVLSDISRSRVVLASTIRKLLVLLARNDIARVVILQSGRASIAYLHLHIGEHYD